MLEVPDDEGADQCDGECELCGRQLQLTFHHLVPKMTHPRYLGKALPADVADAAMGAGLEPEPTKSFLNRLLAPPVLSL